MGTINFGTSDFITLCREPFDPYIYEDEGYTYDYEYEWETCEEILNKYYLNGYSIKVALKTGYYESFYLEIKDDGWNYYDFAQERKWALDEVRELEKCLNELVDEGGMVACCPGWCTTYADYKATKKAIREACKAIRQRIKETPTWLQYQRGYTTTPHRKGMTVKETIARTKEATA